MEHGFIDILKQLVAEQVNAILTDPKQFKSILADYTRNEYKKESRFLIQAVEAGVAKAIKETDDLPSCKKAKINELVEDYGLSQEVSAAIVDTLALVLRGDTSKSVTVMPPVEKTTASQPAPKQENASNKAVEKAATSSTPTKGKLMIDDGEYEGDIVNGKANGKGKYTNFYRDGSVRYIYEGDFVENKCTGKGKTTLTIGDVYEGDFVDGKLHGKGKKISNGKIYEGEWVNGKPNGIQNITRIR